MSIQETFGLYIKRILDFLTYTKNYMIRKNPLKSMIDSIVEGLRDFLTIKKKLKMAQYRLNYHQHQLNKMEQLIAQNSQHNFLKGANLDQKR